MSRSGEAIYGAGISEFDKPEWGRYTQNGDSVYACITETPIGPLPLFGIPHDRIEYVRLLKDGSEVKTLSDWRTENYPGLTFVEFPNYKMLDDVCTVLKIKLK